MKIRKVSINRRRISAKSRTHKVKSSVKPRLRATPFSEKRKIALKKGTLLAICRKTNGKPIVAQFDLAALPRLPEGFTYHPVCLAFPMMGKAELQNFADDIKNGQSQPVTLLGKQVLDGKNILAACELAGIEPKFEQWKGTGSPTEWIISQNLIRRHLTSSQRAVIALDLKPIFDKEARERQQHCSAKQFANLSEKGKASECAARLVKSNSRYIEKAMVIQKQAPDLLERIRVGEINIPKAITLLRKGTEGDWDQTPEELCKQIIRTIPWTAGELVLEPFRGDGNFYRNLPDSVHKDWCELRDGRDFFEYRGPPPDTILTNPPFWNTVDGENLVIPCLERCLQIAQKRVIFLISLKGLNALTTVRLRQYEEWGWGITNIDICDMKKWSSRYFLITWEKHQPSIVRLFQEGSK